jgi:hypothetical protein
MEEAVDNLKEATEPCLDGFPLRKEAKSIMTTLR